MDALRRVRARYEPERNKGTERISVFLVLAPIQPDLDLFESSEKDGEERKDFPGGPFSGAKRRIEVSKTRFVTSNAFPCFAITTCSRD